MHKNIAAYLLCILALSAQLACDEPWGRDCELAQRRCEPYCYCIHDDPMVKLTRALFCFHKGVVSPADGPRSHFKPSSSEYMMGSIEKYGFVQGFALGCDRLMRENSDPWIYRTFVNEDNLETKCDPVP